MRRFIISLCLLFAAPAFAANWYVNNDLIYTGTAVGAGTTTTIVMDATFTASGITGGALVDDDPRIRYMGLFVTGGTGAGINAHKISAYNATTHTITFATALSGSSDNTTAFIITYGSEANTGGSATVGATNVGPKACIQSAYTAASAGDTVWVKSSGETYDEQQNSASAAQQYLNFTRDVNGITIQGYVTTINDLNTSPASTYTATSNDAYGAVAGKSVLVAGGYTAGSVATLPVVNPLDDVGLGTSIYLNNAHTVTFRNLSIQSSLTRLIYVNAMRASAVLTVDQCKLGSGSVNSQIGIYDGANGGTSTCTVSKSYIHTRASNIYSRYHAYLNVTDCHLVLNPQGTAVNNIDIALKGSSPTVAYDSSTDTWYASNQTRRIVIDSNWCNHEAEQAACTGVNIYDVDSSATVGPSWVDHVRITRNRFRVTRSSPILCMTLPSLEVGYNELYTDSSSGGGTLINLGPDAAPTIGPGSQHRKIIRRAQCQAGSGSGTVIVDASASATDNAYRYRKITVYKADGTAVQTRPISGYTGASKTVAYAVDGSNATMSPTPASGDLYEIWEERPQTIIIHDNYAKHSQDVSGNTHGILVGQGWDGVRIWNNTIINSDNGIVAKGNYPVIWDNKLYSGRGSLLVKGGSWGTALNNTFHAARAQGGAGCLDIQDKSSVAISVATPALFRDKWSKSTGWVFLNNIFSVKGQDTYCINDNQADVGTFTAPASLDAAAQKNYFNFNVYAMDGDGNGAFDGGASYPLFYMNGAEVNTVALQRTQWADTAYQPWFNLNQDEASREGSIVFKAPQTGNFSITGGTQSAMLGSDGQLIGAGRSRSYLISR